MRVELIMKSCIINFKTETSGLLSGRNFFAVHMEITGAFDIL